jgi:hypothetical protein
MGLGEYNYGGAATKCEALRPNNALQLTAYSLRFAAAFGSS